VFILRNIEFLDPDLKDCVVDSDKQRFHKISLVNKDESERNL